MSRLTDGETEAAGLDRAWTRRKTRELFAKHLSTPRTGRSGQLGFPSPDPSPSPAAIVLSARVLPFSLTPAAEQASGVQGVMRPLGSRAFPVSVSAGTGSLWDAGGRAAALSLRPTWVQSISSKPFLRARARPETPLSWAAVGGSKTDALRGHYGKCSSRASRRRRARPPLSPWQRASSLARGAGK